MKVKNILDPLATCGQTIRSTSPIVYTEKNKFASLILNRPKSLNALNTDMAKSLVDFVKIWKQEKKVQLVLFEGVGKAFCAGGDIMNYLELLQKKDHEAIIETTKWEYRSTYNVSQMDPI